MKFIVILIYLFFIFNLKAQLLLTPKLGFEIVGFNSLDKSTIRRNDITVIKPVIAPFVSLDYSVIKGKSKFSIALELKNNGLAFVIKNDSSLSQYLLPDSFRASSKSDKTIHFDGTRNLYIGFYYDRILNKFNLIKKITYSYGGGLGIGFNNSISYYNEVQNARYYTKTWNDGINYTSFERFTNPKNSIGVFLKLRGGIALLNKKNRECLLLEAFWNQGFIIMNEHILNYKYGVINNSNSGETVIGYKVNNRGTTAGVTLGFPIYLTKVKKPNIKVKTKPVITQ